MDKVIGAILGGEPGSGKTATMLSYVKQSGGETRRLIIDMESRASSYRAQDYGLDKDDPARLLFTFDVYPDEGAITLEQFCELVKDIDKGTLRYDMIGIDNIALFQDEMAGWCETQDGARKLTQACGSYTKAKAFIESKRWAVGDPAWWKLQKNSIKEFLLLLRRKRIAFVATTELSNKWQDYGKKGYAADGMPFMRIIGKSAALWEPWKQIGDTVWNLKRRTSANEIMTAPQIELDRFAPKCSIVGVPPQFGFTSWGDIWTMEAARVVPTKADVKKLEPPRVEFPESGDDKQTETTSGEFSNWGDVMLKARQTGKAVEADKLRKAGKSYDEAATELFGKPQ